MSFANINLGTTAGDHSGDPLRVAFDKINRNFYQIATGANGVTVISSVDSVAGRTGNVTLTVADVPGAVTAGQVSAIVLSNLDGYANLTYVNSLIPNVTAIDDSIAAAIDAEDLPAIRSSISAQQGQITTNSNAITALQSADTTLSGRITGANAAIVTANTAMKAYVDAKDSVLTSAVAGAWATANSAVAGGSFTAVNASIDEINANVLAANTSIYWLANTVNTGLVPSVSNLWANLTAANAAVVTANTNMKGYVDAVTTAWTANAVTQLGQVNGANAAIITANTQMKNYVDFKVGEIADAWLANAVTQSSQLAGANAAIITANTSLKNYTDNQITTANAALKSYVDTQDSAITSAWTANARSTQSQLTGANAAIVTANTAMKAYVDTVTTAWTANAVAQQGLLETLTANATAQQATLNSHSANITILNDTTIALAGAITQINTGSGFATVPQLTSNVAAINSNVSAVAANVSVHTANIAYITGNLINIDSNLGLIQAALTSLRSNAAVQNQQIFGGNAYNITYTNSLNNQMSANIIAANAQISTLTGNVATLTSDVTSLESAVTGLLVGGIYSYSNSNVASYLPVNSTIIGINSNVAGANAAIVTANTRMKSYVDSHTYTNSNVASYLPTFNGNIGADNISALTQVSAPYIVTDSLVVNGASTLVTASVPIVDLSSLSGSVLVNASYSDYQKIATSGPVTLSFEGWQASGIKCELTLEILIASTAHTITFPAEVSGATGIVGYSANTSTWAAPVTGTYIFTFTTSDGGTTVYVSENNSVLKPYNSSTESISNTGNAIVSLGTTYSTYRTASNGTAFLGNGVAGQIKVLSTAVGNTWVVTTASATWSTGRITFNAPGQIATVVWNSGIGQWAPLTVFGNPSFTL